ncbi:MAG: type IV toxin-antitoxin system AbiEi family antitoxin, partial [Gammaproteobacteria bacterium]|nr:type IV toxin-antitoxin system AbiEi family antitoxin [Gammaproteobacteria bacterium]
QLGKSRAATILSIEHLRKHQKVVSPARGFYVIVIPEYRVYRCLPAEYFIPYLMEYWHEKYYACLVTAASYYGAAHQQPQTFQVMVQQNRESIRCGKVEVDFIINKNLGLYPTQEFATQRSELVVSSPETTAMDLVNYPKQCGGLNRIATILDELQDAIREQKLLELLEFSSQLSWKQRLGYILDKLGADSLAQVILQHLQEMKRVDYIPLNSSQAADAHTNTRNEYWKIIENSNFESDL